MLTRQLFNLQYRVESPSLYLLDMEGLNQSICIAYDGWRRWMVFMDGEWQPQSFRSRDEAAKFLSYSFKDVIQIFDVQ